MCPNCHILLVEANNDNNGNLAASVNTAVSMGALVVSNSYGGGEGGTTGTEPAYDHTGVAITASTGDEGFGAQFPATAPHVIAVGGTHLVKDGSTRGWTETAWGGGGSGCSAVYAKPAWQTASPTRSAPIVWKPTSRPSPTRTPASPSSARRTSVSTRRGSSSAAPALRRHWSAA